MVSSLDPGPRQTADRYRFGAFEVRSKTGLLLREGVRVRIQELPLRMLVILIEHSGEVVSREELRNHLWGKRTFVEFDSSLRVAAAKLREALGDEAARPQFLETVARRGYRFIGEVVPIIEPAAPLRLDSADPPAVAPTTISPLAISPPANPKPPRRDMRPRVAWGLGAAVLLTIIGGWIFRQPGKTAAGQSFQLTRPPLIRSQDTVALGSFLNHTQDRSLDEVLAAPFRVKMTESPYLRFVSNEQFARALLKSAGTSLNDELEACRRLHARVLLTGEVAHSDRGFDMQVDAYDCAQSKRIATATAKANSQDDLLTALGDSCEKMRLSLGESRETLHRFNVPLVRATTSSLAALRAYRLGEQMHVSGNDTESKTYYKLAIDLDPQFALAYLQLGHAYSNTGEPSLSRSYYQRAFDLRERTTELERLYITTSYYSYATGERQRAIEAYQLWSTLYTQDVIPPNNLAVQYMTIARPRDAIASARRAIELDPSLPQPYTVLAGALLMIGDSSALKALCDDPVREASVAAGYHLFCFEAAFDRRDTVAMQREMEWARGKSQECVLINAAARVALYRGRLNESHRLFAAARQSALVNNLPEYAAGIALDEAGMEATLGLATPAKQNALEAFAIGPRGPQEEASVALVWALLGELDRANEAAKQANAQSPLDTLLNHAAIPEVRAVIDMKRNKPEDALRELEQVRPYDLCREMDLMPGYYRGLAYLQFGQLKRAAAEFQSVLSSRAASPLSVYSLLSQLQLAKILSQAEGRDAALALTHELAEIWQGADTGFPPLRDLRALTAKLHPG